MAGIITQDKSPYDPTPKTQRNIQIYKKYKENYRPAVIAEEFNISPARMYAIIHNIEGKIERGELNV